MNQMSLAKEKEEARKNGFILAGKTGTGKSTFLNAISGDNLAKVVKTSESVTTNSTAYLYKLQNGKYIYLIDTPGLCDTRNNINNINMDILNLESIVKEVIDKKIHLKGIIFFTNFQNERIDSGEQDCFVKYNEKFPLPKFWENFILIYTHYYGQGEDGDSKEKLKEDRYKSNGEIITKIMKRIEKVSQPVKYEELKIKYFNSFFPFDSEKKDNQIQKNKIIRNEIEVLLNEFIAKAPLFTQVEKVPLKNFTFKKKGNEDIFYVENATRIGYFGLYGEEPEYEEIRYDEKTVKQIKKGEPPIPEMDLKNIKVYLAEYDIDNTIKLIVKRGDISNSNYAKYYKRGIGIGTAIAGGFASFFLFSNPVGWILATLGSGIIGYGIGHMVFNE